MLFSFNKKNFQVLEVAVIVLVVYVLFTMYQKNSLEGAHCTGGHKKKERFANMKEGMGHSQKLEGMGHQKVEPYGNKRMYR